MDFSRDDSAVFFHEDNLFVPSELARGPWDPDAMHGGPVAALIAREVERAGFGERIGPARMTIELLRPVRLMPLRVEVAMLRPGKRVNVVQASVFAEGEANEIARATALGIRQADVPVGEETEPPVVMPPPPSEGHPPRTSPGFARDHPTFYESAVEISVVSGEFWDPGPATAWFRLVKPIVAGEDTSPLMSVCAAADFGNGISSVLPINEYIFINPDLTVYLRRVPVGEWVCLESATWPGSNGVGIAESALYDERGRIGRSIQSLFIDKR